MIPTIVNINVTINVSDPTRGNVSVGGSPDAPTFVGDFAENTDITIEAKAETGYNFSMWSDGDDNNPRTLTLTQDTIINAVFEPADKEFCITYYSQAVDQNGEGEVKPLINLNGISIEDCDTYEDNYKLFGSFKITPDTGYHFTHWIYGQKIYAETKPLVSRHHDETATVVYGINLYVVETYSNNEAWGKTEGDGEYYYYITATDERKNQNIEHAEYFFSSGPFDHAASLLSQNRLASDFLRLIRQQVNEG